MGGDGDPTKLYNDVRAVNRRKAIMDGDKQYDYKKHDVTKPAKRPSKKTFVPTGEKNPVTGEDVLRPEYVAPVRAPLPIQKYIIDQKASFAAGNGVRLRPSDEQSSVFLDVYRNWYACKADFYLRDIAKKLMADTQVAVIFYGEPGAQSLDEFKFKFVVTSPSTDGAILEPVFDEYRNLVALGREHTDPDTNDTIYDLYIDRDPETPGSRPVRRRYINGGKNYEDMELPYPKLPVVYWEQDRPECDGTDELIKEFEFHNSDFLTQLGYSADPILFGKGRVINLPAKGSAGKFIEGSEDADLKFVTAPNATESRDLGFKMMHKYIFGLNRAVMLDPETMQSLRDPSGVAMQHFLIDVYQGAEDKQQGQYGLGVQRMVNWLTAAWKDLRDVNSDPTTIDVSFSKYRISDVRETVETLLLANGNQPLISHEASIAEAGMADEPAVEYERIRREAQERAPEPGSGPIPNPDQDINPQNV